VETHVNTPQMIFNFPQRLLVPLFQRPYVWDEDRQWRPLWQDVERVADKVLAMDHSTKHFLGAVVLQQEMNSAGTLMVRTIIDGQQRLTTLQLLFDAIHEEILRAGLDQIARRLTDLVENSEHQRREPEDRFKVWPTNRDRDAFAEVMSVPQPVYAELEQASSRLVKAHEFFALQTREWLLVDPEDLLTRASALVDAVATRLQLVVIDLKADEDAQEIFETLNARGTPLTAADLIKNLVFQRLAASADESEKAYHRYWEQFETPFWEKQVSSGRVLWSRSSLFLTQWLVAQTQQDIPAREVFVSFKRHLDDSGDDVSTMLADIKACADVYRSLTQSAENRHEPLDRLEMFTYRAGEMQSEIVKPFIIWLTDPRLSAVPLDQRDRAVAALESWLVRRTLVREKSAGQNRFMIDLLGQLVHEPRNQVGDRLEALLADQTADTAYWPDDEAVRASLEDLPIYRRLSRGRLRMILEAVEDYRRGFPGSGAKGEQPVVRATCTIEHVMPQKWGQHWPLTQGVTGTERDQLVHTLGNLTLVSKALNPSMSNAAWLGEKGKRTGLEEYSSIKITSDVIKMADANESVWDEELIEERTSMLIDDILAIWPVPAAHSNAARRRGMDSSSLTVKDLLDAGLVEVGQELVPNRSGYEDRRATITASGHLVVDGKTYESPSGAGKAVLKRSINGWWFWRVGSPTGVSLKELRSSLHPEENAFDGGPFTDEDWHEWWRSETMVFDELALATTSALPNTDARFPSIKDKGDFRTGRYWALTSGEPHICVGVPKVAPMGVTVSPLWARYNPSTSNFEQARSNLLARRNDVLVDSDTGKLWIPLQINGELSGRALVDDLVLQVRTIDREARGAEEALVD